MIHSTASVDPRGGSIGEMVEILEFVVVRQRVHIGAGVVIHPHVTIEPGVTIGENSEIFPGCVLGKMPSVSAATSRKPGSGEGVQIGANCTLGPNVVVYQDVQIGPRSLLGDGVSVREECRVGAEVILGRNVTLNYSVLVGDGTRVMDGTHLTGNMTVGAGVFIAAGVLSANDNSIGRNPYSEIEMRGPTVEDGAMIGNGALLQPGIRIGRRAVVGAGSVVTRSVPEGVMVMGVPAWPVRQLSGE